MDFLTSLIFSEPGVDFLPVQDAERSPPELKSPPKALDETRVHFDKWSPREHTCAMRSSQCLRQVFGSKENTPTLSQTQLQATTKKKYIAYNLHS